jgi:hypothetical protein
MKRPRLAEDNRKLQRGLRRESIELQRKGTPV